ncbi:MAG: hypothetical protein Q8P07_04785 [bacterium]|nr:hypothetical protein [bacterium]
MQLTYDELNKIITGLPQDVQDAYWSVDVANEILDIGKKHGLAIDKIGNLGEETNLVMTGRSKPADFIKNLTDVLGIDKEKAKAIAEDINQKVFQPIKVSLRKVHGLPAENSSSIQAGRPDEPKAPPPASAPYVIPSKPAVAPTTSSLTPDPPAGEAGKRSDFQGKTDLKEGGKIIPASTIVIGGTKLDFAPLPAPAKTLPPLAPPSKGGESKSGPISSPLEGGPPAGGGRGIPQIFAKKITPIDALLDKVDAGEPVIQPKQKIDSASLQLNPPPAGGTVSGIKTMFQDAKTFLQSKSAPPPSSPSTEPYVIPSKTPPIVTPPPKPADSASVTTSAKEASSSNIQAGRPETTTINVPPKISPAAPLNQQAVKSEIENALKDPYREPVE